MPRVLAIIQARMASSRLPGKVLVNLVGQPMLARVYARTTRSRRISAALVATTTDVTDDPVAEYCSAQGLPHVRGSQFDVLDRYYQAAKPARPDVIVRVTADCPAIDPVLIDDVIDTLLGGHADAEAAQFDFATNRLPPPLSRSFPIGLDVEVCRFEALEQAWMNGRDARHREHVMPYLYEGVQLEPLSPLLSTGISPRGFRIALLNHVPDLGDYRWTVDTPEDLEFMREVYARFRGKDDFSWGQLLALVEQEPALAAINAAVRHKSLNEVDPRAK